jgi:hypothetical protein
MLTYTTVVVVPSLHRLLFNDILVLAPEHFAKDIPKPTLSLLLLL